MKWMLIQKKLVLQIREETLTFAINGAKSFEYT